MSLHFHRRGGLLLVSCRGLFGTLAVSGYLLAFPLPRVPSSPPLRVCADPNNLPFSNQRGEGLENRLAQLLARELRTSVSYLWWAQRRGFLRNTLVAGQCDVVMGVPSDLPSVTPWHVPV